MLYVILYIQPTNAQLIRNNEKYSTWIIYTFHRNKDPLSIPYHLRKLYWKSESKWYHFHISAIRKMNTKTETKPTTIRECGSFVVREIEKRIKYGKKSTIKTVKEWWAVEKWTVEQRTTAHASALFFLFLAVCKDTIMEDASACYTDFDLLFHLIFSTFYFSMPNASMFHVLCSFISHSFHRCQANGEKFVML